MSDQDDPAEDKPPADPALGDLRRFFDPGATIGNLQAHDHGRPDNMPPMEVPEEGA